MRYSHKFEFAGTTQDVIAHVRWCRENLGAIGETWDFTSSHLGKKVHVWILSDKWASWYQLKFISAVKKQ